MLIWILPGGVLVPLGYILLPMWREIAELFDRVSQIPDGAARRRAIYAKLIERTMTALIAPGGGALAIGLGRGFAELILGRISLWSGTSALLLLIGTGHAFRERYRQHIWLLNQSPEDQQRLMALPWALRQEIITREMTICRRAGVRQSTMPKGQLRPDPQSKELVS